ncbi:hypothetical protein HYV57_02080 [Candidatus Peregrinibacteria bacterium]|nr:hypothetical protein [Candidatus Peregrinibacteria bacterium]
MIGDPEHIDKINFLIHPGFLSSLRPEDLDDPDDTSDIEKGIALLPIYTEKAQEIMNRTKELLIIFLHSHKNELKNAVKESCPYILEIQKIRKLLGRRLIVIANDGNGPNVDVTGLKKIITARGYAFDKDVESESGGETIGLCVEDWSEDLNEKLGLTQKTRINTRFTNCRAGNNFEKAQQSFFQEVPDLQEIYTRLIWF